MDKQPTFSERRERLWKAAGDLDRVSAELREARLVVVGEVAAMEQAEKRFAERRSKSTRASR
jgi:hypothetical protein